jgi:hypothetical protein
MFGASRTLGVPDFLSAEPPDKDSGGGGVDNRIQPIKARLPVARAVATAAPPTIMFHATVRAQKSIARWSA